MAPVLTEPSWGDPVSALRLLAIAAGSLALAVSLLAFHGWKLRRFRARIPARIHVAGTRGKSTTTRLITEALRAGGFHVYGKTTGSEPRLLLPDGTERPFARCGRPSVREQARMLAISANGGANAVVIECMAIQPEMLWASETLLIQATTLVVTNARADHLEEFGGDPDAVAESFKWLIPPRGKVVISNEALTERFRRAVEEAGASLTIVDTDALGPAEANHRIALAVASLHGVDPLKSRRAMVTAAPDPGHFTERALIVGGKQVRFANAFACNDVESLARLWTRQTDPAGSVVILNARGDRPVRTQQFLNFLARQNPMPILFVSGDSLACVLARRAGFAASSVRRLRSNARAALADVAATTAPGGTVWCIGNYSGFGADLTAALVEAGRPC